MSIELRDEEEKCVICSGGRVLVCMSVSLCVVTLLSDMLTEYKTKKRERESPDAAYLKSSRIRNVELSTT